MKKAKAFILIFYLMLMLLPCYPQASNTSGSASASVEDKIDVYYFHFTRRCVTCRAVEEQSKLAVEQLYPEQIKNGLISFSSINLDDENSKSIAKKLDVSGQSLLVVKGSKVIDITAQGFLHARSNPDRLKGEIKKTIASL